MEELVKAYERLADLCRQQTLCIATEDTDRLNCLIEEKGSLLAAIERVLPHARATCDAAALERILAAAHAAAAEEDVAVRALGAGLESVRQRLRQAGGGRIALRSYRPGDHSRTLIDSYSG